MYIQIVVSEWNDKSLSCLQFYQCMHTLGFDRVGLIVILKYRDARYSLGTLLLLCELNIPRLTSLLLHFLSTATVEVLQIVFGSSWVHRALLELLL